MPAARDEMEPPQIAVETLGGDAAEASQEVLDLVVATVDRLNVHGPAHPLALAAFECEGLVGLADPQLDRRQRGLALRRVRQNRSNLATLLRRQFIDSRKPVPKKFRANLLPVPPRERPMAGACPPPACRRA